MSEKRLRKSSLNSLTNPREFAFLILCGANNSGFISDYLSDSIDKTKMNEKDKRLAAELVINTIRAKGSLTELINLYCQNNVKPIQEGLLNLLSLGFYQLRFMDKIPPFAAVNETVELAKKYFGKSQSGFVNAIMRNVIRYPDKISVFETGLDPISKLAYAESHPKWLINRWLKHYSFDDTSFFCSFNNLKPCIVLNVNDSKISVDDFMDLLAKNGIESKKSHLHKGCLRINQSIRVDLIPGYSEGLFYVQDETPVMLIDKMDIKSGDVVLDVCAAPGGKTCAIARKVGVSGKVFSVDISENRMYTLKNNIDRLGLKNVTVVIADASKYNILKDKLGCQKFDKIVVDAPCSNTGVLRKRVEARWRLNETDFDRLAEIQLEILSNSAMFLKSGGQLLYSTCSIDNTENDNVIDNFLKIKTGFSLLDKYLFFPKSVNYSDGGFGALFIKN